MAGGGTIELEVGRWRAVPDRDEAELLHRLTEPVLDIGCGPGRVPRALAASGRLVLGIDPAQAAADEAARSGAPVLRRSVFAPLPGEGRWGTALLLDGNVGIGGDPVALLRRCCELLRTGGHVIAEVAAPGAPSAPMRVRVESGAKTGPWFPWAVVGVDAWHGVVEAAGLAPDGFETVGTRWFGRAVCP
ncbi:MAG: methyltransferase domain-containing protein [Acidimicrobiales bacterium]